MSPLFARCGLLVLMLLPFSPVWAATAVVDAVQMPAWLERGNRVEPLVPGQKVGDGDKLRTGQGARVYLKLPEGSTVKLGEGALLTYQSAAQENSIFRAALDVAVGAFRFTTASIRKLQKRDVAIRVGNATIGIRGTDVWGVSGQDQDLVVLIEGHVVVQAAQGGPVLLTEPLALFTAPKGGAANPVGAVTIEQLTERAKETDIAPGAGAIRSGGKVRLLLGSFDEQQAIDTHDRARAAGYGARIRPVKLDGGSEGAASTGYRYEVAIAGFHSRAEAAAAADSLKRLTGIDAAR